MNPQQTIDEFFQQDGVVVNGKKKRSVLLAVIEDIGFTLNVFGRWKNINFPGLKARGFLYQVYRVLRKTRPFYIALRIPGKFLIFLSLHPRLKISRGFRQDDYKTY